MAFYFMAVINGAWLLTTYIPPGIMLRAFDIFRHISTLTIPKCNNPTWASWKGFPGCFLRWWPIDWDLTGWTSPWKKKTFFFWGGRTHVFGTFQSEESHKSLEHDVIISTFDSLKHGSSLKKMMGALDKHGLGNFTSGCLVFGQLHGKHRKVPFF